MTVPQPADLRLGSPGGFALQCDHTVLGGVHLTGDAGLPTYGGRNCSAKKMKINSQICVVYNKLYKDNCSHPIQTRHRFCSLGQRSWQPGRCMFLSPLVLYSEVLECSHLERYWNTCAHQQISATVNHKQTLFYYLKTIDLSTI